jgi:hypothetical protein
VGAQPPPSFCNPQCISTLSNFIFFPASATSEFTAVTDVAIPGTISLGVKRPKREAVYSPQSGVETNNDGAIPPLPSYGVMLN